MAETTPRIEAWNKLDLVDDERRDELVVEAERRDDAVALSAVSGEGIGALLDRIAVRLTQGHRRYVLHLPASDGAGLAWLHAHGEVVTQHGDGEEMTVEVRLSDADHHRFTQQHGPGSA